MTEGQEFAKAYDEQTHIYFQHHYFNLVNSIFNIIDTQTVWILYLQHIYIYILLSSFFDQTFIRLINMFLMMAQGNEVIHYKWET